MCKWHGILERDIERVKFGSWIGFSMEQQLDPMVVFKNETIFDPQCMKKTRLSLPIKAPCFMVGLQSGCLQEWPQPEGCFEGSFHEVRVVKTKNAK